VGRARVTSEITQESDVVTFAVLHFGSHNLTGGIRRFAGEDEFRTLRDELLRAFSTADIAAVVRLLANFPEYSFSLKSLFGDRQRAILYRVLESSLADAERAYRRLYEDNASLMRFLISQDLPLPRAFRLAAEFVLNRDLRAALYRSGHRARTGAASLLEEAEATRYSSTAKGLGYAVERALERLAPRSSSTPTMCSGWRTGPTREPDVHCRSTSTCGRSQNVFYDLLHRPCTRDGATRRGRR
jgi:hypothetical protein